MEDHTNNEHKSSIRKMLSGGAIAEWYGSKWFCKVLPAFSIDKVQVTFVKLGTQGAHLDIWVNTDVFAYFTQQILTGELWPKLNTQDPLFRYSTGDNGADKLQIIRGNAGILIRGRAKLVTKDKSASAQYENATVVISNTATLVNDKTVEQSLRQQAAIDSGKGCLFVMALLYQTISGMRQASGYYEELAHLYWDSAKERNTRYSSEQSSHENATVSQFPQTPVGNSGHEAVGSYVLSHTLAKYLGHYYGKVKASDGREAYIYIPENLVNSLSPERRNALVNLPVGSDLAIYFSYPFSVGQGQKGLLVTKLAS